MSERAWPDDVTVRDWRWLPVLLLATSAGMVAGVFVFRATSRGEGPLVPIVVFLACAGVAIAANVELRVRLYGDRAGIRLSKTFVAWYEVVTIEPGDDGHGGVVRLTDGRQILMPAVVSPSDLDGLRSLREEAGKFGVGRLEHPPVSPLRSLPMDREVLPSGTGRGIGSACIVLLVLGALLWPMLPRSGTGTAIPPTRHFPDDALRPIWSQYLPQPRLQSSNVEFVARREGAAIPVGAPLDIGTRVLGNTVLQQFTRSGRVAWAVPLESQVVTVNQFGQQRVIRISPDWQVAPGDAGVAMLGMRDWSQAAADVSAIAVAVGGRPPMAVSRRDSHAPKTCCRLRLVNDGGSVAWERTIDLGKERPWLIAAGSSFLLVQDDRVPGARCPGGCDEHRVQMTALSPEGKLQDAGYADVVGREGWGSYAWLHGELLALTESTSWEEPTSYLTSIRPGGEVTWKTSIAGSLQEIVATQKGYAAFLTEYDREKWYEPPKRWVIGLGLDGTELWRRGLGGRTSQLLTAGSRTYMLQQRLIGSGPVTMLYEIDPATGDTTSQWEVATVRIDPQLAVADGVAYLYSAYNPPYTIQRYEWPPESAGED